jgi:LysR family hydrogen peroxide-inducible transcriptional activator
MGATLRELEYFVAIADRRHFGKAAEAVRVSQPTLSMQFKKLEDRLGGTLIERLPREAILTPLGAEVLPLARQILQLSSEIAIRCGDKTAHGRIRLGVIPTLAPYLLPKINRDLSRVFQGRTIALLEAQTGELLRLLREGLIDSAILSTPLSESGFEQEELFSEPFYLAVSRSHPLSKHKKVSLDQLSSEPLLLLKEGHCLRAQALAICKRTEVVEEPDLSATSIETLRSMVGMGAGMTLIPKLAIRKGDGISYLSITDGSPERRIGLVYRPSFSDYEFVRSLSGILRDAAIRNGMEVI